MQQLYDHEIDAIDKGPVKWMIEKQHTAMDLEDFRKGAEEKFAEIGIEARVNAWTTTESGTFAFEVDILGRMDKKHVFDYDRQVHEVVNNYLQDPDADTGFIKTDFSKFEKPHTH